MVYAPYGTGGAHYGLNLYGGPTQVSISTQITVKPVGYGTLVINWVPGPQPTAGTWQRQVLVRSSYGVPTSVYDGVVLLDEVAQATPQAYTAQYSDAGLKSGLFYYYALFVLVRDQQATPQPEVFVLAGWAQGLVLSDWGFTGTYTSWTPEFYFDLDGAFATDAQPIGPLKRFLRLVGYETDWLRTEIETLSTFSDVNTISGALLPYLAGNYGMTYEADLGMTRSRVLTKNAVALYKQKGTAAGIAATSASYTGFGCSVTSGKNLMVQLDDGAFDRSGGHWVGVTANSTVTSIPYTGPLPLPHTAYDPVPAELSLQVGWSADGYLPVNNVRVGAMSAGFNGPGPQWTQLNPSPSPTNRSGAAYAYDTANEQLVVFGGVDDAGNRLGDTWVWDGSSWSNVTPPTPTTPQPRINAAFCAFVGAIVFANVPPTYLLFGGETADGVFLNDTWRLRYISGSWEWEDVTPLPVPESGGGIPGIWYLPTPAPSPRAGAAMTSAITDPYPAFETVPNFRDGGVWLFGGVGADGVFLNDMWAWNDFYQVWGIQTTTNVITPPPPPGRAYATFAILDGILSSGVPTSTFVVMGGKDKSGALSDIWVGNGTISPFQDASYGWYELSSGSFVARYGASAAVDSVNNGIIVFGGVGSSGEELSDTLFVSITLGLGRPIYTPHGPLGPDLSTATASVAPVSGGGPAARSFASMVYDASGSPGMILFGGASDSTYLNDTWKLTSHSGTWTWTEITPSNPPIGRSGAVMAYTGATADYTTGGATSGGVSFLFGGVTANPFTGASAGLGDTWEWNNVAGTWTVLFEVSPPPTVGAAASFDASAACVVVFGGETAFGPTNAVWLWNGGAQTWTHLFSATGTAPSVRSFAAACYLTEGNLVIGGEGAAALGLSDAFVLKWSGSTWAWTGVSGTPPGRFGASLCALPGGTTALYYGGYATAGSLVDDTTWIWSAAGTWTSYAASAPGPRAYAQLDYDLSFVGALLFGGQGVSGVLDDTWEWNTASNTWSLVTLSVVAVGRASGVMAYVSLTGNTVLFGGSTGPDEALGDTWVLSSAAIPQFFKASTCTPATATTLGVPIPQSGSAPLTYVLSASFLSSSADSGNLVTPVDASFETGIGSAVGAGCTVAQSTDQALDGTHSLAVTATGGSPSCTIGPYPVTTGSSYTGFGSIRAGTRVLPWTATLRWYSAGTFISSSAGAVAYDTTSGWTQVSVTSTAPFSATAVYVEFSTTGASTGRVDYIDCVGLNLGVSSVWITPATAESFSLQLDWYDVNGQLISATTGPPFLDSPTAWAQAFVVGSPPSGARYVGQTVAAAAELSGDIHYIDAVQLEVNTQSTPGPTAWEPPRDIKVNLFPVRQNLIPDPQGLGGGYRWLSGANTTLAVTTEAAIPAIGTVSGYSMSYSLSGEGDVSLTSNTIPVTPGVAYSLLCYAWPGAGLMARAVSISLQFADSAGTALGVPATKSYTESSGPTTPMGLADQVAPANAATVVVSITVEGVGGTGSGEYHLVSGIMLEPSSFVNIYFDGNQNPTTDFIFEGTPNQSVADYYPLLLSKLSRLVQVLPDYTPIGSTFSLVIGSAAFNDIFVIKEILMTYGSATTLYGSTVTTYSGTS